MAGTSDIILTKAIDSFHPSPTYPVTVTLSTASVEEDFTKQATEVDIPRPPSKYTQEPKKLILDFLKVKNSFTVNGYIGSTATKTASQVRNDLRQLIKGGGTITMTYDGTDFTVNPIRANIREIQSDYDTASSPTPTTDVMKYEVQITLLVGVDINNR